MIESENDGPTLPNRDSLEFSAALLLGAVIGVFAARSLRPRRSRADRIRRRVRRPMKRVRQQGAATRESAGETVSQGTRLAGDLRDLAGEFIQATQEEWRQIDLPGDRRSGLSAALEGLRSLRGRLSPER